MAQENIKQSDELYLEAVDKMRKFHDDPYAYYDERIQRSHALITKKLNDKNKF